MEAVDDSSQKGCSRQEESRDLSIKVWCYIDRVGNLYASGAVTKKSTAWAEYGMMLLRVLLCCALQKLRPCSLHGGRLQDRQAGTAGCPLIYVS